jgi:hypothetical protein
MILIAESTHRAEHQSPASFNRKIHEETERRVGALAGHPKRIRRRLEELDREWDIERWLETGSATLTLTGLALGTFVNRRWLLLSAIVQGFFMQHAIQGPPLPLFRGLGVRTAREVEAERHALKALLGEYDKAAISERRDDDDADGGIAHEVFQRAMQ